MNLIKHLSIYFILEYQQYRRMYNRNNEAPCCTWILRCFDVRMMQKRRRPLGERAGQLQFNCPSELIQII